MENLATDKWLFLKGITVQRVWEVLHQVNASLTAHKLLLADGEHASALQHLRVGAAGIDTGLEGLLCHPDRKPLQLAVAQQARGVQAPAGGEDTRKLILSPKPACFSLTLVLQGF